jgi:phosphoribosylaminoimidazole carboxylase
VAVDNAENGALLAVRILGSNCPDILTKMKHFQRSMKDVVLGKVSKMESEGWEAYSKE